MNKFLNCCLLTSLAVFVLTEMNIGNCTLVLEHTHDMSTEYVTDDEYHYYECSECGHKTNTEAHDYSDWIYVKEATKDDKDGIQTKTCSICKKVVSREYTYNNLSDYEDIIKRKNNIIRDDYNVVTENGVSFSGFKKLETYLLDNYYNDNSGYYYGFFRKNELGMYIFNGNYDQYIYFDFDGNEYTNGPVLCEQVCIYDEQFNNNAYLHKNAQGVTFGQLTVTSIFFKVKNPTGNLTCKLENLAILSSDNEYGYKLSYYDGDTLIGELFVYTELTLTKDYFDQFIMLIDSNLELDDSYNDPWK